MYVWRPNKGMWPLGVTGDFEQVVGTELCSCEGAESISNSDPFLQPAQGIF